MNKIPTLEQIATQIENEFPFDVSESPTEFACRVAKEALKLHLKAQADAIIEKGYELGKELSNDWDMDEETIRTAYSIEEMK